MASIATVLPRRDFLRTLGRAAGISVPALPVTRPVTTPTESPMPTPAAPAAPPAVPTETGAAPDVTLPVIPSPADRHLLSRFSYGITPQVVLDTAALGAGAWFEDQLDPDSVPDAYAGSLKAWWPHLSWTPVRLWQEDQSVDGMKSWEMQADFARWTLLRRIYSKRQVHETMAEFWSNLLHIPAPLNKCFPHRMLYDATIRQHALGRFDEMLAAAVLHPSMLCYLDNAKSTSRAVNENLGRELLELHSAGRDAGFTEAEVSDSAMILTGWHVDTDASWEASYETEDHYTEPVDVLGFHAVNDDPDGRQVAWDYLYYLAHHPSTATQIARRLAVRFVSDEPSDQLVSDLAEVFAGSGTSIKATMRALVAHPDFLAAAGVKVRTPTEDTVNTFRVLEIGMTEPTGEDSDAAHAILNLASAMGQKPFDWPRPDGFPDAADAWSSASRALGSWRVHKNTSHTLYPGTGVEYHPKEFWVPALPIRFDLLVDILSRQLLAMPATAQMQRAAAKAVEVDLDELVLPLSQLVKHRIPQLLLALLDTPQHMMR